MLVGSLVEPLARRGRITHLAIPDDVQQADDIGSTRQVLQNLDLPLDLLLLDRLEYFDNTLLICRQVHRLEDLEGEGAVSALSILRAHYHGIWDLPQSTSLFRPFERSHSCPEYPTARPGCLLKEADMSIEDKGAFYGTYRSPTMICPTSRSRRGTRGPGKSRGSALMTTTFFM